MEKQERKFKFIENFIYLIIWIIFFIIPLWDFDQSYNSSEIDWEATFHVWKLLLPLFILFLVNNYILLPFLLIRKKSWLYLLFTTCAVLLTTFVCMQSMPNRNFPPNRSPWIEREFTQKSEQRPPQLPKQRPEHLQHQKPQPPEHRFKPEVPPTPRTGLFHFPMFLFPNFLLTLLIIGVNIAIKLLFKSIRDDHKMKDLQKQASDAELAYLKHQINPHFFMNTLNNIHALIDIDKEKAQKTVLELSKIMRYVLYESSLSSVPLEKEIHFLYNYIELMKIRYTEQVKIGVSLPEQIPDTQIPPLLFISFLENAFKHGISYQHESFIHLSMEIKDEELHCLIVNSLHPTKPTKQTGIGLENTRKRLQLLYQI